jgi:hypothetical protein
MGTFPPEVARLFWEVDPRDIDVDEHRDYVLERVMTRGGWRAMRWLRETYPPDALADFLDRKAHRLSPRDRAYWSLVSGRTARPTPGGGSPPWAGS